MDVPQPAAPPGWYPDPDRAGLRYFDGRAWTEHRTPPLVAVPQRAVLPPTPETIARRRQTKRAWLIVAGVFGALVIAVGIEAAVQGSTGKPWTIRTDACRTDTGVFGGTSVATGTITNSSSQAHTYEISADFGYNGASAYDGQFATTDLTVAAGQTANWTVVHNHAGPIDTVSCGGIVSAVDGLPVS
jgi:uncharacterized protein DUF2510